MKHLKEPAKAAQGQGYMWSRGPSFFSAAFLLDILPSCHLVQFLREFGQVAIDGN